MLCALIMAGGSGQRFWPLSTEEKPKQLLELFTDKSMIRETVDRILPLISAEKIFIATNIRQLKGIKEALPMIREENIILEPTFKDTAAAIGYGTLYIKQRFEDSEIVVLASDHLIQDEHSFRCIIEQAASEARLNGSIITLGIKPTKPETAYGYIEVDEDSELNKVSEVKHFYEKPNLKKAINFLATGNFLWNSGIFIFNSNIIMDEIERFMPNHKRILDRLESIIAKDIWGRDLTAEVESHFELFEKISIDFGVMEKSEKIRVIPCEFGWNDVGSFTAIEDIWEPDESGSYVKDTHYKSLDSTGNIIISNNDTIVTIGVDDLVIVKNGSNLLVCHKDRVQDLKKVLKNNG
ncbi:mannose-1-phosphate guanylyltransferase [Petrocella sp. FN5]|uniref:mannose-1-phosphate guanylyltransferase n=1 Tax=Petrocella sp. FN5 TaxID=3032002 RepID=UPI0023DC23D3|nr:mannose-1-phosphate guanylyltransferase [Petrocella sp. FN5]MDF1617760.1 mannose-1-phosphate guanylyltransferase [Petrocella sp. FN5]